MVKHLDKMNDARVKTKTAGKKFVDIIKEYSKTLNIKDGDSIEIFKRVLGLGILNDYMFASDIGLRRKSTKILTKLLIDLFVREPELNFYFVTFTHDIGNTSDRSPQINVKKFQKMVDQALRKLKLSSIYVFELQGLGNHPRGGYGRTIMLHSHGVIWSKDELDCEEFMHNLNSGPVWLNSLNSKPVNLKPILNNEGDLAYISYYMFKPPYDVKMLEKRTNGPRLKSTEKGYRPEFAARILEGLCQLEIKTMVRSTLEGKYIRTEWFRRLRYWHRSRPYWANNKNTNTDIIEFWSKYRNKKKQKKYHPYIIKY